MHFKVHIFDNKATIIANFRVLNSKLIKGIIWNYLKKL